MNVGRLIKQPSAFLPVAMSFATLVMVLGAVCVGGAVRQADEGAVAHLFQLLMVAQVPIVAFFAVKWLSRTPKQAIQVLALQFGAALAALAPVFCFHL